MTIDATKETKYRNPKHVSKPHTGPQPKNQKHKKETKQKLRNTHDHMHRHADATQGYST
jgi:hypothetical protein